jgi:YHS domain-containing protein
MVAPQAASADVTQCLRVQPAIENIITAARGRAEAARLSNSPTEMRAAVEQLDAALRDIRAQSAPCSLAAASTDAHAGHTMPAIQQPADVPAAPMDHSKMPMGGGAAADKPGSAPGPSPAVPAAPMDHSKMPMGAGAPAAKPGDATGAKPAPMDHSKMEMGGEAAPGTVVDPVNGLTVDPGRAPKTTYHGQTYYFSSEQSRKEFLSNPAKFAKKPKG